MELIATNAAKQVWLRELARPYQFAPPFPGELYVGVLFANDESISAQDQARLSAQLVRSGCRYAVCAGHACSSWDDSIDSAYLATDQDFAPPAETFVMTSWHERDTVEEILFHGLMCTNFQAHDFHRYLVLLIGPRAGLREEVREAVQAVWDQQCPR